jgi:hypothetical protein
MNHHAPLMDTANSGVICKGCKGFSVITDPKKIRFDAFYHHNILASEIFHVTTQNNIHKKDLPNIPQVHSKDLFSFEGAKEWYL